MIERYLWYVAAVVVVGVIYGVWVFRKRRRHEEV